MVTLDFSMEASSAPDLLFLAAEPVAAFIRQLDEKGYVGDVSLSVTLDRPLPDPPKDRA